jgi:hypothetical protein
MVIVCIKSKEKNLDKTLEYATIKLELTPFDFETEIGRINSVI